MASKVPALVGTPVVAYEPDQPDEPGWVRLVRFIR
jgi:hypothetical protein